MDDTPNHPVSICTLGKQPHPAEAVGRTRNKMCDMIIVGYVNP